MKPKLQSDDENFFKLEGIIQIKNDRKSVDKVELQEKLFGLRIRRGMEWGFYNNMID